MSHEDTLELTSRDQSPATRTTGAPPEALVGLLGVISALVATWLGVRAHQGGSIGPDLLVAREIVGDRDRALTLLAHILTFLGSEIVMGALALLLLAAMCRRRAWLDALTVSVAVSGAAVLVLGLKVLVGRPRPGAALRLGPADHAWSFPSGHTLSSTVVVALLAWVLVRAAHRRWTVWIVAISALLVLGIAGSRVYLGYHWLSDVAASLLIAVSWLLAVRAGRIVALAHPVFPEPQLPSPSSMLASEPGRQVTRSQRSGRAKPSS